VRGIRERLTYANVMVTILAVLVIGGGGAYAAKKIKLKNNSVTTAKIRNGAVTDPKLAASVGDRSIGRMDYRANCDVSSLGDVCVSLQLPHPRPARILVIGDGTAFLSGSGSGGACQLRVDGTGVSLGTSFAGGPSTEPFSISGVTGVFGPGTRTVEMLCSELAGDFEVDESHLSAVTLGAE
jgi:hypothetical protein